MPALLGTTRFTRLPESNQRKTAADYERLSTNLYVLDLVPAWPLTTNRLTALVKAPKRYLLDTGLAAVAAGLTADDVVDDPDLLGRFFDAFGTAQLRPELGLMDPIVPVMYHLRTQGGRHEVDLVLDLGRRRVVGIDFKAASGVDYRDVRHLITMRDDLGERFVAGVVLYSGATIFELGDRIYAVPLCAVWN